jgi:Coenzyme PQQ synthesis protein D (PqqD)
VPTVGARSVPRRRLDARIRNTRGVVIVAGPQQALELSDVALSVWRHIDGIRTVADIGRELAREFEIDEDTAVADVTELLTDLASARVVTVGPSQRAAPTDGAQVKAQRGEHEQRRARP